MSDGRYPDAPRWFRVLWALTRWVPGSRGSRFRVPMLRRAGATIGTGVRIGPGVKILAPKGLTLGDRVGIARDACLDARGRLSVGAGTMVGFESVLLSMTHRYDNVDLLIADQGFDPQSVDVGAGVWIGARAFLLPGVSVGENSIIGTASVVTKPVPANVIAAGSPAKVLRDR